MSYCAFSSNNFRCDLYCYKDMDGAYTTYVALDRIVGKLPKIDDSLRSHGAKQRKEWTKQVKAHSLALSNARRQPIGLPFDGQRFNDATLQTFRMRLLTLRNAGYRFPPDVLTKIDAEIAERDRALATTP